MALAAVALTSCVRLGLGGLPDPSASGNPLQGMSPAPSQAPILGGISDGEPGNQAHPTPTSQAGATARPTQPPSTPYAVEVTVRPSEATVNVHSRVSATPLYPTQVQLTAEVLLSSGLTSTQVRWRSTRPETATVDEHGLVTAGSAIGDALIVATSLDGLATAAARITLTDHSAAEVVVD